MGLDVELEFEQTEEITCPYCGKKSKHIIKGIATGEIEPPETDDER